MNPPLLVCLDLQRAFIEDTPLRAPHAAEALMEGARLVAFARRRGWTIVHCLLRRSASPVLVDGDLALPVSGFAPRSSEPVIERKTLSAYGHSAFATLMEAAPAKTALVACLSASITFLATAIDAFERGHSLVVAADALAAQDGPEAAAIDHQAVARDVAAQLGFAAARMHSALREPIERIGIEGGRNGYG
jgi:nicotinamidase-related amidase